MMGKPRMSCEDCIINIRGNMGIGENLEHELKNSDNEIRVLRQKVLF